MASSAVKQASKVKALPRRSQVKAADTWDLASLCPDDAAWETAFEQWEKQIAGFDAFRGKLGESARTLAACLRFDADFDRAGERLGTYAFLKTAEDATNSQYQRMLGRYRHAASQAAQAASFIRPEIMAIKSAVMEKFLASKELAEFRLLVERMLRYKPHTLSRSGEKLLAMQSEMAEASNQIFRQLSDADLKWGLVKNERGEWVELSNSSLSAFLHSPKRSVRKQAFHKFYEQYSAHQNTLAATLGSSVQRDVYYAKARGYPSALEAALFHDNMPLAVYDNLIASVHRHLPALYRYYELRRRKMQLTEIHHYDTYVPILSEGELRRTWSQAVKLVIAALEPLGSEYCDTLLEPGSPAAGATAIPTKGSRAGPSVADRTTAIPIS